MCFTSFVAFTSGACLNVIDYIESLAWSTVTSKHTLMEWNVFEGKDADICQYRQWRNPQKVSKQHWSDGWIKTLRPITQIVQNVKYWLFRYWMISDEIREKPSFKATYKPPGRSSEWFKKEHRIVKLYSFPCFDTLLTNFSMFQSNT